MRNTVILLMMLSSSYTNDADIFININRKLERLHDGATRDTIIDINIIPNERIIIDGVTYVLYSVNIWKSGHYVSFFRCNGEYYFYDDYYNPENMEDYIINILI